jgi:hypothetical protein
MSKSRNHVAKELWTPKFRPKRVEGKRKYEKKWLESQEFDGEDE